MTASRSPVKKVEKPQFDKSEALGLLAAILILLLAFGSVIALLFGFSMDYQVFLVSRIREEWRAGPAGSITADSDAVANALARTGRIITSAAAIMICVFAAFVLGDLRVLRVIGSVWRWPCYWTPHWSAWWPPLRSCS
jgi:uncharacterized membrane protein YdfJ with MMPL/SSD domain